MMSRAVLAMPWLAWRHLWSRPLYAAMSLLLLSLALTVAGLLADLVQRVPRQLERELQGVDLLVGPKGDPWRQTLSGALLLGAPAGGIPYETLPALRELPQVAQAVPLLAGGRHRGFAVLGTEPAFMELRRARLAQGRAFERAMEVVLGADAARSLGLAVGAEFSGLDQAGRAQASPSQRAFLVVGVLARQDSALDGVILTDLSSLWALRQPEGGMPPSLTDGLSGASSAAPAPAGGEESLGEISFVLLSPASPQSRSVLLPWLNAQDRLQATLPTEALQQMGAALAWLPLLLKTLLLLLLLCAWLAAFALMLQAQEQRRQDLVLLRVLGAPAWRVAALPLLEWLWLAALAFGLAWGLSELSLMGLRRLVPPEQLHWLGTQGRMPLLAGRLAMVGGLLALAGAAWPAWSAWRLQVSRLLQPGE